MIDHPEIADLWGVMMKRRIRGTIPEVEEKAREMRGRPTTAEDVLWYALRQEQIRGFRFRRQHAIGRFIFDFCCTRCKLIVEVDGEYHDERKELDAARDAYLADGGFTTLRFTNAEVLRDLPGVVARIDAALPAERPPRRIPLRDTVPEIEDDPDGRD